MASAFGVYVGRFLRFNSWDVISNPLVLIRELSARVINPQDHPRTWGFTCLFGLLFVLIHHTIRKLSQVQPSNP